MQELAEKQEYINILRNETKTENIKKSDELL